MPSCMRRKPTENEMRGTIKELIEQKISLDGKTMLSQVDLSTLTRLGFAKNVGKAGKVSNTRGREAGIWEFDDVVYIRFKPAQIVNGNEDAPLTFELA